MSGSHASAGEQPDESTAGADYDRMLARLDDAIEEAHRKIEHGRVYDAENERVRQGWIKTLAYVMNVRRQVVTDRDLEELGKRIEQLEATQEEGSS